MRLTTTHTHKIFTTVAVLVSVGGPALAQPGVAPPANGPKHADPKPTHILIGATIHPTPVTADIIPDGAVVLLDGRIVSVGPMTDELRASTKEPKGGTVVWDLCGMHVYAGFIDPAVEVEIARPGPAGGANATDRHWNINILPERSALAGAGIDKPTADALRKLGFTAAGVHPVDPGKRRGGVIRGTASVVSLAVGPSNADPLAAMPTVYLADWAVSAAFESGGFGGGREDSEESSWFGGFPTSRMGAIALFRQTMYDLDGWKAGRPGTDRVTPKWVTTLRDSKSFLFDTDSEIDALRALAAGQEFGRRTVIIGSGTEYRRLSAVAMAMTAARSSEASPWIIPLADPRTPEVGSVGRMEDIDLRTLMAWEQSPTNARRLEEAGVRASLTTAKLRDRGEFFTQLRKAIDHGLPKDAALAMVTTRPATLLGVGDKLGTIAAGKVANLVIADGDLFAPKASAAEGKADAKADTKPETKPDTKEGEKPDTDDAPKPTGNARVMTVWIEGTRHEFATPAIDMAGMWKIDIPGAPPAERFVQFEGELGGSKTPKATILRDGKRVTAQVKADGETLTMIFDHEPLDGQKGMFTVSGSVLKEKGKAVAFLGKGFRPNGAAFDFRAERMGPTLAIGRWRVTEADGKAKPEGDGDQLFMDVTAKGVKLTFSKAEGDPIEITADEVVAAGNSLKFKHGLKKLGGEGDSTDAAIVEGDTLKGEGTLPDGSKHAYTAVRVKPVEAAKKEPKMDPSLVGRWVVVGFDGEPAPDAGTVYIKTDGTVVFNSRGTINIATDVKPEGKTIGYTVGDNGEMKVSATADGNAMSGTLTIAGGPSHAWNAERRLGNPDVLAEIPEVIPVPFQAYGTLPDQDTGATVIRGVTAWTMGAKGKLENATVAVADGKIAFVGTASEYEAWTKPKDWSPRTIDGTGKHITPGIIDCHSHTGLRTANEVGRAVTSMVRVEDELNADDINWYRQLAGGVTAVNNLHGSANSIGGQNTVTKLRWGVADPLAMKMTEAPAGIKFALGENPKRGNSGTGSTFRYPQTRMGVETQIRDRFQAAKEYAAARAKDPATPRDLELEPLAEILAGTRLIHCHSYRQDEILMLGHIARDFGFKIGTYQHILEGYKVAEVLKEFSGGASGFSDWWAYKVEVQDAIPFAFPLMHKVGVLCSFNSDDSELARRLNTEAAKAVKYGGLGEEESLAFVTLNPAKQLKIDAYVGSIEPGKQADLAVWNGSPLSSLSRCERTFVDGIERFSIEQDTKLRARNAADRQRITQRILKDAAPAARASGAAAGDGPPRGGRRRPPSMSSAEFVDMLSRGMDPYAVRAGDCDVDNQGTEVAR